MSNRLNFSLADAYFAADKASTLIETYNKKQEKLDQYNDIYEDLYDAQTKAAEDKGLFATAGKIVGTIAGAILGSPGGPIGMAAGAKAGYEIGGGAGEFTYEITDELGDIFNIETIQDEMEDLRAQIDNFDWDLGVESNKYNALQNEQWEDNMKTQSDEDYREAGIFMETFYNPWYIDLVEDVLVPIGSTYLTNSQFESFTNKKLGDFSQYVSDAATGLDDPDFSSVYSNQITVGP